MKQAARYAAPIRRAKDSGDSERRPARPAGRLRSEAGRQNWSATFFSAASFSAFML
jgi:hypothetical protein